MRVVVRVGMIERLVDRVLMEMHWLDVVLVIVGVVKAAMSRVVSRVVQIRVIIRFVSLSSVSLSIDVRGF